MESMLIWINSKSHIVDLRIALFVTKSLMHYASYDVFTKSLNRKIQ